MRRTRVLRQLIEDSLYVVDERLVEAVRGAGGAIYVWTVNEPDLEREYIRIGVDGIITDRPTTLVALLRKRDESWCP